jgi:hypothetical protein
MGHAAIRVLSCCVGAVAVHISLHYYHNWSWCWLRITGGQCHKCMPYSWLNLGHLCTERDLFSYTGLFVAWLPKLILGSNEIMWNRQIVRSGWRVLLILYYMWTVMNKIALPYRCPLSFSVVFCYFLGSFAKLRKAAISFVISARPHGTTRLPLDGFSWNLIFEDFSKNCRENSSFIKIGQE